MRALFGVATASLACATASAQTPAFDPVAELKTFIELGGPVIAVLLVVSVIGLALVLAKVVQFALARAGAHRFVASVATKLRAGDMEGAESELSHQRGPVASVMRAAIAGRKMNAPEPLVREEVERIAQAELDGLERGLASLSLVASISPLLGLLGTVTGLIKAFQELSTAGDRVDPAILASGIWEALLTTVLGLVIAIPASAAYLWLQRTVEMTGQRMENAATQVFTVALYRDRPQAEAA